MSPEQLLARVGRLRKAIQTPVGLADNAEGVPFRCGTCEHFSDGRCTNSNPKLNGRKVDPKWCCNLYDHAGMRVVVE